MKKEDIDFLVDLQNELKTQDNDGTANPLYWGVMEEKEVIMPDGYGDHTKICYGFEGDRLELKDFVELVGEYVSESDDEDIKEEWNQLDKTYDFEVVDFANGYFDMNAEILEFAYTEEISRTANCFLTKRACKDYIKKFGYNHNKPKTYAMCAYRNFEYERLLNIITNLNIEDIKVD